MHISKKSSTFVWTFEYMRKRLLFTLIISIAALTAQANSVYRDTCYSVGLSGTYAYNETYGHYGAFTVDAYLPITYYFEGEVNIRMATANVHDFGLHFRPKFILPVGELYFDTQIMYNLIKRNELHGICAGFSFGYRMDYVKVHIGYGTRTFATIQKSKHSSETSVHEPHNLIYYAEVFVRPHTSSWNLSFCATNMTDYQMERMFTPMFIVNSFVNIGPHWRLTLRGLCKPVGISNYAPSFYGAEGSIGIHYRF